MTTPPAPVPADSEAVRRAEAAAARAEAAADRAERAAGTTATSVPPPKPEPPQGRIPRVMPDGSIAWVRP